MAIQADTMLSGGTVITVDGERRIFRDGAVAFQGSQIVAVGKRAELERSVNAKKVMDCRRRLIMPDYKALVGEWEDMLGRRRAMGDARCCTRTTPSR